ncbi:hypothetical protein F4703DRAFT_1867133 [Phycomyces blakesleeanus]
MLYQENSNSSPKKTFYSDHQKTSSSTCPIPSEKKPVNRKQGKVPLHVLEYDQPISKPPMYNSQKYTAGLLSSTAPTSPSIRTHLDEALPTPSLDQPYSLSSETSPVLNTVLKAERKANISNPHRDLRAEKHKTTRIGAGIKRRSDKNILRPPIKKFNCSECGYMSSRKSNYTRHIEQHDDERQKWKCDTCAKSYSSKFNLERHITSTHTNYNESK